MKNAEYSKIPPLKCLYFKSSQQKNQNLVQKRTRALEATIKFKRMLLMKRRCHPKTDWIWSTRNTIWITATFAVYPKKFTAIIVARHLNIRLSKFFEFNLSKIIFDIKPIPEIFFNQTIIQTAAYTNALLEVSRRILLLIVDPVEVKITKKLPVTGLKMSIYISYMYSKNSTNVEYSFSTCW